MTRRGGLTAIDGAIALIAILLVIQMWLADGDVGSLPCRAQRTPAARSDHFRYSLCGLRGSLPFHSSHRRIR
jgi:hypothetical protein